MKKPVKVKVGKISESAVEKSNAEHVDNERTPEEANIAPLDKASSAITTNVASSSFKENPEAKKAWDSLLRSELVEQTLEATQFDQLEGYKQGTAEAVNKMVETVAVMVMTKTKNSSFFSQDLNTVIASAANAGVGLKDIESFIVIASAVHQVQPDYMLELFRAEFGNAVSNFKNLPPILYESQPPQYREEAKNKERITTNIIARAATEKDLGKQLARLINNANMTSELPDADMVKQLSETLKAFKKASYKNAMSPQLASYIDMLDKLLDKATKSDKNISEKLSNQISEHLNVMWQNDTVFKELLDSPKTLSTSASTADIAISTAFAGADTPQMTEMVTKTTLVTNAWDIVLNSELVSTPASIPNYGGTLQPTAKSVDSMIEAIEIMVATKNKDLPRLHQILTEVFKQASNGGVGFNDIEKFIRASCKDRGIPEEAMVEIFRAERKEIIEEFYQQYPTLPRILQNTIPSKPRTPKGEDYELSAVVVDRALSEKTLGKQLAIAIDDSRGIRDITTIVALGRLSETTKAFMLTPNKNNVSPELSNALATLDRLLDEASTQKKELPPNLREQLYQHLRSMAQNQTLIDELNAPVVVVQKAKSTNDQDISIDAGIAGVNTPSLTEKIATSVAHITKSDVSPSAISEEVKAAETGRVDTTTAASSATAEAAGPIVTPHVMLPKDKDEITASLPKADANLMEADSQELPGEAKAVHEAPPLNSSDGGMIEEPVVSQVASKEAKLERQLDALDVELDQVVNNNLKDFYKSGVFFEMYEQHYLSLGNKIDMAQLGFTHQELRDTVERIKEFANQLEQINGNRKGQSAEDAHQHALEISKLINSNPRFYTDTMNFMNYSYKLKGAFQKANDGFTDTGRTLAVDQYATKFAQWISKYPLHLQRYDELMITNKELIENNPKYAAYVERIKQLKENFAEIIAKLNTSQKYLDLKPLNEPKSRFSSTKESISSTLVNQNLQEVYKQLESYFNGNLSGQKNIAGNINNLLQLYVNALQGRTTSDNKEIILKNIPLLLANIQAIDPTNIDQKMMADLRNEVGNIFNPKAQFPIDLKKDEKKFRPLCNSAIKAIDDTNQKAQEKSKAQAEAQLSSATTAAPPAPPPTAPTNITAAEAGIADTTVTASTVEAEVAGPAVPPVLGRAATLDESKGKEEAYAASQRNAEALSTVAQPDIEPASTAAAASLEARLPPLNTTPGLGIFPQFLKAAEERRDAIRQQAKKDFIKQFPGKPVPAGDTSVKLGFIDSIRYGYRVAKNEMTAEKTNIYLETGAPKANAFIKAGPSTAGRSFLSRESLRNFTAMVRNGLSTVGLMIGGGAAVTVNSVTGGIGNVERAKRNIEDRINSCQGALEDFAKQLNNTGVDSTIGRVQLFGANLAKRIGSEGMEAKLDGLLIKVFDQLQADRAKLAGNEGLQAMGQKYQGFRSDITISIINKVASTPEDREAAQVLVDIVSHLTPPATAATNQAGIVQPAQQVEPSMEATAVKVTNVAASIQVPLKPLSTSTTAPAAAPDVPPPTAATEAKDAKASIVETKAAVFTSIPRMDVDDLDTILRDCKVSIMKDYIKGEYSPIDLRRQIEDHNELVKNAQKGHEENASMFNDRFITRSDLEAIKGNILPPIILEAFREDVLPTELPPAPPLKASSAASRTVDLPRPPAPPAAAAATQSNPVADSSKVTDDIKGKIAEIERDIEIARAEDEQAEARPSIPAEGGVESRDTGLLDTVIAEMEENKQATAKPDAQANLSESQVGEQINEFLEEAGSPPPAPNLNEEQVEEQNRDIENLWGNQQGAAQQTEKKDSPSSDTTARTGLTEMQAPPDQPPKQVTAQTTTLSLGVLKELENVSKLVSASVAATSHASTAKAASSSFAPPSTDAKEANITVKFTIFEIQQNKVKEIIANQTNPTVDPWPPQASTRGVAKKAIASFSCRVDQMADVARQLAKLDPLPRMSDSCSKPFKDAFKEAVQEVEAVSAAKNVQVQRNK